MTMTANQTNGTTDEKHTGQTRREALLASIDDADDRRTVAALTDLRQTHLTAREARDWGGQS